MLNLNNETGSSQKYSFHGLIKAVNQDKIFFS